MFGCCEQQHQPRAISFSCPTSSLFTSGSPRNSGGPSPGRQSPARPSPALKGQVLKGQVLKGQVLKGQVLKGQVLKGQVLKGQVLKGQVLKGQVLKGQVLKGQVLKEQVLKEQVLKEQVLKKQVLEEHSERLSFERPSTGATYKLRFPLLTKVFCKMASVNILNLNCTLVSLIHFKFTKKVTSNLVVFLETLIFSSSILSPLLTKLLEHLI
jgi:hypothetical protein